VYMGEGSEKPLPPWAQKRMEDWKRAQDVPDDSKQSEAFRARRARREASTVKDSSPGAESGFEERPMRDREVRARALTAVRTEKEKGSKHDRLTTGHSERGRRARSSNDRRLEKLANGPVSERAWRLGVLLRSGAYDSNRFKMLPDMVTVGMKRWQEPDRDGAMAPKKEMLEIAKNTLGQWLKELEPHERQRLYVIGRRKLEFRFDEDDYPQWKIKEGDTPDRQAWKKAKMEGERRFQKEQKELADALEIVAIPMLKSAFAALGHKNVDVYLSGLPDDLAGGIDTIVEFKDSGGNQIYFSDGSPMVLVIDVTYARMRDKIPAEMKKGRISEDAQEILKGDSDKMDPELSSARATKLFRTLVETLGGTMSTQTFDKNGPLKTPREHVPRLIIGLDWDNAFSMIINWVEHGEEFASFFRSTGLARRIATSVRKQLAGLHAFAANDGNNPNIPHLAELLKEIGAEPLRQLAYDDSLNNLDNLLTTDPGYGGKKRWKMDERELKRLAKRKRAWRLRQRFYDAALAQVAHDRARGGRMRGDRGPATTVASEEQRPSVEKTEGKAAEIPEWQQQLAAALEEKGNESEPTASIISSRLPEYQGGISGEKQTYGVIAEKASDRAGELVEEINAKWRGSRINEKGERFIMSKKDKKETSWGKWLSDTLNEKVKNWSDKEKAYVRGHLPQRTSVAASRGGMSVVQQTVENQHDKDTSGPRARVSERDRQARILEIEREIAVLKRQRRIKELERQIQEAKSRK